MNKSGFILVALVVAATSVAAQTGGAGAQGKQNAQGKDKADDMFMREAAMSSMAEVAHGQLAGKNASAEAVKQFGARMVADHTKANEELKGLASKKGVTLPTELDQKHEAMQARLSKLTGDAFDKAYMSHMVTAHQQAVTLFEREAKNGSDADAKGWAAKTLPTLQEHLKLARDLNTKIGGK